ncbi:hypothetical protein G6F68_012495 [Rhizopus microsporus]|nr:hypothetical protein G6F68_012495 [Rhizopus microsporus]
MPASSSKASCGGRVTPSPAPASASCVDGASTEVLAGNGGHAVKLSQRFRECDRTHSRSTPSRPAPTAFAGQRPALPVRDPLLEEGAHTHRLERFAPAQLAGGLRHQQAAVGVQHQQVRVVALHFRELGEEGSVGLFVAGVDLHPHVVGVAEAAQVAVAFHQLVPRRAAIAGRVADLEQDALLAALGFHLGGGQIVGGVSGRVELRAEPGDGGDRPVARWAG